MVQKRKKEESKKLHYMPEWIFKCEQILSPKEEIEVAEWCENNRYVDKKISSHPGIWDNTLTPYLVEIMNTINDYRISEVVFCKPSQVGGTESIFNIIGYIIAQDPSPTMVVYPTDILAESISVNRLQPIFEASPKIREHFYKEISQKLELQFDNMYISLTGANSPSALSSKPIRYLMLDEVDKYPPASRKEADPISLARERTKTFRNSKLVITSTPTLRSGYIWKAKENADIEKHYFIPCPHCGKMIELKFNQIKFPKEEEVKGLKNIDRADLAVYECQHCHKHINNSEKNKAVQKGEWRIVRQDKKNYSKVAYWLNTLYSPFVSFSDIVNEFLSSKDDIDKLRNFTNSWLAEPWEETRTKTNAELVLERQTELEMWQVPEWGKLITAGVDVQENCLYYTIRAWGDYLTSQCIAHGQVSSFSDIDRVMNVEFKKKDGTSMLVELCLVDSGDQTDEVYEFCHQHSEWAKPCKGVANSLSHYRISQVNRPNSKVNGMHLILVDGGKYKSIIASRLQKSNGIGSFMTYKDTDMEYCEQLTSEQLVTERRGLNEIQVWKPKTENIDNHYLDCEVYCFAAADICDVRSLYLQNVLEKNESVEMKEFDEQVKEDNNWINNFENGDWIK